MFLSKHLSMTVNFLLKSSVQQASDNVSGRWKTKKKFSCKTI